MNLFSTIGGTVFSSLTDERMTRVQRIQRENERTNLLTVSRLVLRSLLDSCMRSCNRIVDTDPQELADLFMMLEKVLFHGFRPASAKNIISLKSVDAELWTALTRISYENEFMRETVECIQRIDTLQSPISRVRAFMRLAVMQKRLSDYFTVLIDSRNISEYYEQWALLRHDDIVKLSGALLALSTIECSLPIEFEQLQDQVLSVDLSLYVRIPTVPTEDGTESEAEAQPSAKDTKMLLDQNHYLEEQVRFLQRNVQSLRKQLSSAESSSPVTIGDEVTEETTSQNGVDEKEKWDEERERLCSQIVEREDSLRIVQQQLADVKKVNADLYEKLRIAEVAEKKWEADFRRVRQNLADERESFKQHVESLQESLQFLQSRVDSKKSDEEAVRAELGKKCEQYARTLGLLQEKQQEAAEANARVQEYKRKMDTMETDVTQLKMVRQEVAELRDRYLKASTRSDDLEAALEELGGHLSESKLQMVELKEELLPLGDAQWAKDSEVHNCTTCEEPFTFSRRKHHCRMCGSIFCSTCSEGRVKLPSNSKPARVCVKCFGLLRNRQNALVSKD